MPVVGGMAPSARTSPGGRHPPPLLDALSDRQLVTEDGRVTSAPDVINLGRTWVELDLSALEANVRDVVSELTPVPLMAVVKANAYGHGALLVARCALAGGASWLATATVGEAAQLRMAGIDAPCLVLGYTPPEHALEAVRLQLVVTVFDLAVAAALEEAGARLGTTARAHLKVDTGMTRLGIRPEEVAGFVGATQGMSHLCLEGIYTHLRKGQDLQATSVQLERLQAAFTFAEGAGHCFRLRHAANSAAWNHLPEARLDLVRSGGEILGLSTADGRRRRPVLTFKSTVAQVHTAAPGTFVGYGDSFQTEAPMLVATLPIGYGDGLRRGPVTWDSVLIRGRRHPLVGDVSMDMAMVDVTSDPGIAPGDQVVLLGRQGPDEITVDEIARQLGTINYEVVTGITARVPRLGDHR